MLLDERGFFFESWNSREFAAATGANVEFVQDNHSRSRRGVPRGLHYQVQQPQGKLVRCIAGEMRDERTPLWNDPALGIDWLLEGTPLPAPKHARGMPLAQAEAYP